MRGYKKNLTTCKPLEFRFKRDFLHNLSETIEQAYDLLGQFKPLWDYAAGSVQNGDDTNYSR